MRERPENFALKRDHPLAKGLVFAGLGRAPGSVSYRDSAPYGNHGTLTNMDPPTDWVWVSKLGRWGLYFNGLNNYVSGVSLSVTYPFTLAAWVPLTGVPSSAMMMALSVGSSTGDANVNHGLGHAFGNALVVYRCDTTLRLNFVMFGLAIGWYHMAMCVHSGTFANVYVSGMYNSTMTDDSGGVGGWNRLHVGASSKPLIDGYCEGTVVDPLFYSRALSLPEIQQLADPSNVMLSGLIEPPRRKYYVIKSTIISTYKRNPFRSSLFTPSWVK